MSKKLSIHILFYQTKIILAEVVTRNKERSLAMAVSHPVVYQEVMYLSGQI
jgi:hypothetical protein